MPAGAASATAAGAGSAPGAGGLVALADGPDFGAIGPIACSGTSRVTEGRGVLVQLGSGVLRRLGTGVPRRLACGVLLRLAGGVPPQEKAEPREDGARDDGAEASPAAGWFQRVSRVSLL